MRSRIRFAVVVIASIAAAVGGAANAEARTSARADLIVGRLSNPPKRVVAGRRFAITDVVSNRGADPARRSVTRYYLTSGRRVLLAGTRRVPALAAHGRSRGRAHLTIRAGAGGRYSVIACADATRRVRERNERNNCRAARRRVAVPGPDGAVPPSQPSPPLGSVDSDHDGYPDGLDCAPRDTSVHPGASDKPDLRFVDANCDGIDGDLAHAVFVSPAGNDANAGTMSRPLRTLAAAIAAADARDKDVYAADGVYPEELRLAKTIR